MVYDYGFDFLVVVEDYLCATVVGKVVAVDVVDVVKRAVAAVGDCVVVVGDAQSQLGHKQTGRGGRSGCGCLLRIITVIVLIRGIVLN